MNSIENPDLPGVSPPVAYSCWIVPDSRSFSVVMVEQATESFPPDYKVKTGSRSVMTRTEWRTAPVKVITSTLKKSMAALAPQCAFRNVAQGEEDIPGFFSLVGDDRLLVSVDPACKHHEEHCHWFGFHCSSSP